MKRTPLQRRTPLAVRTPMRRGSGLRRATIRPKARTSEPKVTVRRPRRTGPSPAQRRVVADRAGFCCELCGASLYIQDVGWTAPHSYHHRRPRGAGGSRATDTNRPPNLLLVCGTGTTGCHGRVESDRADAIRQGWLVPQGTDPTTVPVRIRGRLALLTADGCYADLAGNHDHGHGPCPDCNPDEEAR